MLIQNSSELERLCSELSRAPFVAVDTEFLRERTYWPRLCLVQVAHDERAAVIDALAPGIDLEPVWTLLSEPAVVKVLHSASQDLELFLHEMGRLPAPVFDTQIAAMVAGHGDQVGYAALARSITGAHIDKASQRTDWSRRPLTERQIAYALSDVTHLCAIYERLVAELEAKGRLEWIADEMAALADEDAYRTDPLDAYRRIKIRRPSRRDLQLLRAVAAWRERRAQQRDLPRQWVLKDDAVTEIATHAPRSAAELERVRGMSADAARGRIGKEILATVRDALAAPEEEWPAAPSRRPPLRPNDDQVALLQALLKLRCREHDVAPKLVATRAELDRLSAGESDGVRALRGWRRHLFGDDAEALLDGRLALTGDGDDVRVVRL